MTPTALAQLLDRGDTHQPPCTCRALDSPGQNPTCEAHPWWRHDPAVLHLADHTQKLGPWDAAIATFGGSA